MVERFYLIAILVAMFWVSHLDRLRYIKLHEHLHTIEAALEEQGDG